MLLRSMLNFPTMRPLLLELVRCKICKKSATITEMILGLLFAKQTYGEAVAYYGVALCRKFVGEYFYRRERDLVSKIGLT